MDRAALEWRNRMLAEYTSAAITAATVQWMIEAMLPDELVRTGLRIVGDELDHALLCEEVVRVLEPTPTPMAVDVSRLRIERGDESVLAALVDVVLRCFCLGETFAVPLFHAMREHARLPEAREALGRILRDEAVHRAFGWQALDALLERDPTGVRARVEARFATSERWFQQAYGRAAGGAPLTVAEREAGLLPASRYRELHAATLHGEILPRLQRRGISVRAGDGARAPARDGSS